jgi:hypothetical protein
MEDDIRFGIEKIGPVYGNGLKWLMMWIKLQVWILAILIHLVFFYESLYVYVDNNKWLRIPT